MWFILDTSRKRCRALCDITEKRWFPFFREKTQGEGSFCILWFLPEETQTCTVTSHNAPHRLRVRDPTAVVVSANKQLMSCCFLGRAVLLSEALISSSPFCCVIRSERLSSSSFFSLFLSFIYSLKITHNYSPVWCLTGGEPDGSIWVTCDSETTITLETAGSCGQGVCFF